VGGYRKNAKVKKKKNKPEKKNTLTCGKKKAKEKAIKGKRYMFLPKGGHGDLFPVTGNVGENEYLNNNNKGESGKKIPLEKERKGPGSEKRCN